MLVGRLPGVEGEEAARTNVKVGELADGTRARRVSGNEPGEPVKRLDRRMGCSASEENVSST
jgi:hypothetical protein